MALTLVASVLAVQAVATRRGDPAIVSEARDRPAPEAVADLEDEPLARAGFAGPRFPAEEASPTGRTDRTQQWFAGGRWWAVLLDEDNNEFHIWALAGPEGPWLDTGVLVEARADVQPDVVWTGNKLLVVSAGTRSYRSHAARITRFSFDEAESRWTRDADFPIAITDDGVHAATVRVTEDGTIWVAYLDEQGLRVTSSVTGGLVWSTDESPGHSSAAAASQFSASVHGNQLTLGWRTEEDATLYLARRDGPATGGVWTTREHALAGIGGGGDLVVRDGRPVGIDATLAVLEHRTDDTTGSLEPAITLYRIGTDGQVSEHLVARVADHLAQPRLVLDPSSRTVTVVTTSTNEAGTIRRTEAPAETLAFDLGRGRPAIRFPTVGPAADPLIAAAPAEGAGSLLLAGARPAGRYLATVLDIGGPVTLSSSDSVASLEGGTILHDSFEERPLGSPAATNWYYRGSPGGGSTTVATGRDTRAINLMVDRDGDGHERCRDVPPVSVQPITVEAVVSIQGGGGADARLLTVRGSTGVLLSARLSQRGDVGWLTETGRQRGLRVSPGTPLRVVATLDPSTRTYRLTIATLADDVLLDVGETRWLADDATEIDSVCMTPPDGPPGSAILIDDLLVAEADPAPR